MTSIVERSLRAQINALKEEAETERGFTDSYIRRLHKAQDRIAELEAERDALVDAAKEILACRENETVIDWRPSGYLYTEEFGRAECRLGDAIAKAEGREKGR